MAKIQAIGSETVNAYGAQGLPASFKLVVNGRNGTVAQVGFNIRDLNGQKFYVSDMLDGSDARVAETALKNANLKYQKRSRNNFGANGAGDCTIFQLSEVPIGLANDPDYCKKVVAFVGGQRVA